MYLRTIGHFDNTTVGQDIFAAGFRLDDDWTFVESALSLPHSSKAEDSLILLGFGDSTTRGDIVERCGQDAFDDLVSSGKLIEIGSVKSVNRGWVHGAFLGDITDSGDEDGIRAFLIAQRELHQEEWKDFLSEQIILQNESTG